MHFETGRRPRRFVGLTSLIDVVFLLVVFFMLASRFGDEGKLVLDVASVAPAANASTEAARRIDIDARGALRLQGEVIAADDLQRSLARDPELPVLVLPAGQAPLQSIVSVLERVAAAGVTRAALAPAAASAPPGAATAPGRSRLRPRGDAPASS